MTNQRALAQILRALKEAEKKHPSWPENRLRQVAIVVEEAGEALREALNIIEFEEKLVRTTRSVPYDVTLDHHALAMLEEELKKEITQTAAMALRWLINWNPLYAEDRSDKATS